MKKYEKRKERHIELLLYLFLTMYVLDLHLTVVDIFFQSAKESTPELKQFSKTIVTTNLPYSLTIITII